LIQERAYSERSAASDREKVITGGVARLASALSNKQYCDAVPVLRQILIMLGGMQISRSLWEEIRQYAEASAIIGLPETDCIELSIRPWHSTWLKDSEQIDSFALRSTVPVSVGDGILNAMRPGWTHYRSEAQKAAVDAWLFAPPGSTTLVTLPTGGGKSLCTILPAWLDARGGRVNAGTTLVIVPTVALALDQQNQARSFFKGSAVPEARTGANTLHERREIEMRLRDGSLPILFTSPESLLWSRLHEICLNAAEEGLLTRLVIDEAHLIESWGAGFRPEFQLLSAFRRQLIRRSGGKLKTLLLSATVSGRSRETLENLFSEPGKLATVQANRLRPEIGYWFSLAPNDYVRNQRVSEALRFLPRPLILYVTRPSQAEEWVKRLRKEGYERIATFTGETGSEERQAVLEAWMTDQIDIMVGTSAFGLGVDKGDVRAIVHATLPENIDRFYQEVGRAGRDGFSASSILCTCPQDVDLAYSLSPKRITFEKAEPRWRAMLNTPNHVLSGDKRRINRDAVPVGKHRSAVEVDRDWNDHLLLLLQRAGAIQVSEMDLPDFSPDTVPSAELVIRVLDHRLIDDPEYFRQVFERAREQEKDTNPTDQLMGIVRDYAEGNTHTCIGRRFAEIYDDVEIACGGCSGCRHEMREPYGGTTLDFQVTYPPALARHVNAAADIADAMASKMGAWKALNVSWVGQRNVDSLLSVLELLPEVVRLGFQQVIIPDDLLTDHDRSAAFVRALARHDREFTVYPHRIIPVSWIGHRNRTPLFPLPSVIVYPTDDRSADRVYQAIKLAEKQGVYLPACINIVHTALRLPSEGKQFTEHVDGLQESLDYFVAHLKNYRSVS
jgi:superfamily II DNA/RNA helicase